MLIDDYLSVYQFSEYHSIVVRNRAEQIFPVIKNTNFRKSKFLNFLFIVRGLPAKMNSIDGFVDSGFILLEEHENKEIVLGFLFGVTLRKIKVVLPNEFKKFIDPRYIKGVWNFRLSRKDNKTILSTETRVFCPTKKSKILFSIYWFFISYFSGLIRMIILKLIKHESELTTHTAQIRTVRLRREK